jgi:predicted RNA-binding protein
MERPMIYLCAVSQRFPENLDIGVQARVWGVEERYVNKISRVRPGDTLVFLVGGDFRSVHRIESEPFKDSTLLWPEKNGSRFPHRVRISPPLFRGKVHAPPLTQKISFMRGRERWSGTVQGAHGVFNPKMTEDDLRLVTSRMTPVAAPAVEPSPIPIEPARIPFGLLEDQMGRAVTDLFAALGLRHAADAAQTWLSEGDAYRVLAVDRHDGARVVVVVDSGKGTAGLVLQALRHLSELRAEGGARASVRAIILSDRLSDELVRVTREIPALEARQFRVRIELDPDPQGGEGRHLASIA